MPRMLKTGEVLTSIRGRTLSPVPKIAFDTNRKAMATFRRIDAWLLKEALLEVESQKSKSYHIPDGILWYHNGSLPLSPDDRTTCNEILFGEEGKLRNVH